MSIKYLVTIEDFAEGHYLKNFRKKYNKSFDIPWKAFLLLLEKFDLLLKRSGTNAISDKDGKIVICKSEFKILPNESAKSSGNRCIIVQDKEKMEVRILLVYCKHDIQGGNETVWWSNIIKNNYLEYKNLL
ncbi:MAG: hypothetical protein Q7S11_01630 [bacterium]|nr:hypothetical protein [bacterium]